MFNVLSNEIPFIFIIFVLCKISGLWYGVAHMFMTWTHVNSYDLCRQGKGKGHCVEDYDMDYGTDVKIPLYYDCWFNENDHGEVDNLFENDIINAQPKVFFLDIV